VRAEEAIPLWNFLNSWEKERENIDAAKIANYNTSYEIFYVTHSTK
jgi:hypothetical protein